MTRARGEEARDLAPDAHKAEIVLNRAFDRRGDLGNRIFRQIWRTIRFVLAHPSTNLDPLF